MKKILCITVMSILYSSPCWSGEWNSTGSLNLARPEFCSITLDDGRVLVAGGHGFGGATNYCEIFDPNTESWTETDSMNYSRRSFSLTKLSDGMVLAVGGYGLPGEYSGDKAEVWDPTTELWTEVANMNNSRGSHNAVLLLNEKVLVVGGDASNDYKGAEIYDSNTNTWTLTGFCSWPKVSHSLELLPDGRVMAIAGGSSVFNKAEIWNPATGFWTEIAELNVQREKHTSHLLPNGNIIVIGGTGYGGAPYCLTACEIYDFAIGQWAFADSLENGRFKHSSMILLNKQILVVGGIGGDISCEICINNEWQMGPSLTYSMAEGKSVILDDERVLGIGQYNSQIYTWNYQPSVSQQIQGPNQGTIGETLSFSVVATDPDGDSISVRIDWGDDEFSQWTDLQPSGNTFELSHTYAQYGQYEMRVQTADQWYFLNEECHNSLSNWSEPPLIVNISGIPQISILTEPLEFGFVYIGEDSTKTITISNLGNGILNVNLETNTTEFSVWPENLNLEPDESLGFEITFIPSYEGIILDTLIILSNDPQYPELQIELIGEGEILVSAENEVFPEAIKLINHPNPFNPTTIISFIVKNKSNVELSIYNIKGQKINTLAHNEFAKGSHSVEWNGDDDFGKPISSGIYFYKLNVNGKTEAVKKCLLLK